MDALHASVLWLAAVLPSATYQTENFTVTAPTPEFAQQVGDAAEYFRRELAKEWLGRIMPRWSQRCPISVKVGDYGAGGATSFNFENGEVYGWRMNVQGSAERILDSVLPHEVNHTIFASYFRRPLPRWADEGAASLIEHESERMRLKKIHEQVMRSTRKIPLRQLLPMREYPTDNQQVLTLYAEGYSLADFLIQQSNKRDYLRFLAMAHESGWKTALRQCYGYGSVDDLEKDLDGWILAGSPALESPEGQMLAFSNVRPQRQVATIRAQSDELPIRLGNAGALMEPARPVQEMAVSSPEQPQPPSREPREGLAAPVVVSEPIRTGKLSRVGLNAPALTETPARLLAP